MLGSRRLLATPTFSMFLDFTLAIYKKGAPLEAWGIYAAPRSLECLQKDRNKRRSFVSESF